MLYYGMSLQKACDLLGGRSELARLLDVSPQLVHQWLHEKRPIAAHHCLAIEQATNGLVTVEDLAPGLAESLERAGYVRKVQHSASQQLRRKQSS